MRWVQRLFTYIAPPIEVGSRWIDRSDKGNPFAEWAVDIEAVDKGFVQYRYVRPKDGYRASDTSSMSVSTFRYAYTPLS